MGRVLRIICVIVGIWMSLELMLIFSGSVLAADWGNPKAAARPQKTKPRVEVLLSKSIPKVVIKGVSVQKMISIENDKSQPPKSLTQRYRVLYETPKGQRNTLIVQLERNNKGQILKANLLNPPTTKMGGGMISPVIGGCDDSCEFKCILILDMRTGQKTYWCFWIGGDCDDC